MLDSKIEELNQEALSHLGVEAWRSGHFMFALYKDDEVIGCVRGPREWDADYGYDALFKIVVNHAVHRRVGSGEYPLYAFELYSPRGVRCFYHCY
jgi:hypothetical protein